MNAQRGDKLPTFDSIAQEISLQAGRLLKAGEEPQVLEIGKLQDVVLKQGGVTDSPFITSAPVGVPEPSFRPIGEPFKATQVKRVQLRIDRLPLDNWLHVTAGG